VFAQKVAITFVDGTSKDVVLSQWSIGQFAQWAARQGLAVDVGAPGLLGVVMLRYQAYCELHRDPSTPRASFDRWDMTVDSVDPEEPEAVDPTEAAPSDG
jgi:hypothetical protein